MTCDVQLKTPGTSELRDTQVLGDQFSVFDQGGISTLPPNAANGQLSGKVDVTGEWASLRRNHVKIAVMAAGS